MEKMLGEASKTKSVYFNLKVRQFFVGHFVKQTNIKTKIASPLLQTDAEVYTSLTNQIMPTIRIIISFKSINQFSVLRFHGTQRSADMNTAIKTSFSFFQFKNTIRSEPSCSFAFNLAEHKIGVTIALCIIFVFSLLGNSWIAVVIYKTPTLRKPINFLIVNMAMSDLLFSLILVPVTLVYLHLHSWVIAEAVSASITCKVTPYLADVSLLVSVQTLVVIAVDRFVAVVFPLRVSLLTSKRCLLCIVSIWIVSTLVAIPHLDANILSEFDGNYFCVTDWKGASVDGMLIADFYLGFATLLVYVPIALLIILYATIFTKIKSQKIPREGFTFCERQHVKRNRNVSRRAVAIVLKFIACQLPSTVIILFSLHSANLLPCTFLIYSEIVVFVSFVCSAVNLCICIALSGNNREGFKKVLKCFSSPTQNAKKHTCVHKCT